VTDKKYRSSYDCGANPFLTKKGTLMQSTKLSLTAYLPHVPFLFSPLSFYARFLSLTDQHDPRGIRSRSPSF